MRIATVVGTVTLNRQHPSFLGATLKLVVPMTLADLTGKTQPASDPLVVWDELGAGLGDRIAISEGAEAAQPFYPDVKPVDAYNAAIIDQLEIDSV